MTTLEQFLKDKQARLQDGNVWMTWDTYAAEWVVKLHPYRARRSRTVYTGTDIQEALRQFTLAKGEA